MTWFATSPDWVANRDWLRPDPIPVLGADLTSARFLGSVWTMVRVLLVLIFLVAAFPSRPWANPALERAPSGTKESRLRFEVKVDRSGSLPPLDGRLFVVLGSPSGAEPRLGLGATGLKGAAVVARDVAGWKGAEAVALDDRNALSPLRELSELPPGDYRIQAVLATNRDLLLPNAPGNWFSTPIAMHLDPQRRSVVSLTLNQRVPEEALPENTDLTRFVKFRSEVLSRFWGRPMFLRAGIVLPAGFDSEPTRRYPLVVEIGGYGTRYHVVQERLSASSPFRSQWTAADTKRFVLLQLDGAGPLGDPYQVDSANHGPYGTALVEELIPYVESIYRCLGQPHARFTTGGSTGGWVSMALQVFYPDYFGGCWSGYPDPLDFKAFQLVNLYDDPNAFVNGEGFERPSARALNGDTLFTMRHEMQVENVLGRGDSFTRSGAQWGAWNATFSPRAPDGSPMPIWDPRTGALNSAVAQHWKKYDLRQVMADHWEELGPKLRGKLHVWVGDADDYFLDGAVRRMDAFLRLAQPSAEARIEFGSQQRHGWRPRSYPEMLAEMQSAVETHAPKSAQAGMDYLRARFGHAANCPLCKGGR